MVVRITKPETAQDKNMCYGCSVHCCELEIDLTSYDIARIMFAGRTLDFVKFVESEGRHALAFKALGKMVKLVLKKKNDGLCIFFDGKRELYCSIEEFKPGVCLAYPMEIRDGKATIREDVICPKENLKRADFNKMSKKMLEDWTWEWDRYAEFIEDWNSFARGDEEPNEFLKFAYKEMEAEMNPVKSILRNIRRRFSRT